MSKNIENRRAFFKKAAQAALAVPFLAVAAKEIAAAETQVGPSLSCDYTCSSTCTGSCTVSCTGRCYGGCSNGCLYSCAGSCDNSCAGSTKGRSGGGRGGRGGNPLPAPGSPPRF